MTWRNAFKRAIATFTVALVLLIWTLIIYFAGFSSGMSAVYPAFPAQQKGPHIANPTPMDT